MLQKGDKGNLDIEIFERDKKITEYFHHKNIESDPTNEKILEEDKIILSQVKIIEEVKKAETKDGGIQIECYLQTPKNNEVRNVLIVIDTYGWAFDFAATGIKKYSKHNVTIKKYNEVKTSDYETYDTVFFMNKSCLFALRPIIRDVINHIENKCIGIRSGIFYNGKLADCDQPIVGWKIACNSQPTYDYLKRQQIPNIFLCRNGVDTEIFKRIRRPKDRFVVGWAGDTKKAEKRVNLLEKLNFPVKIINNHGPKYFTKNRDRKEMVEFYESIDCYICTSIVEGMPQPILEAGASGLPIVSTAVGGIPEFIDKEWLVQPSPEKVVVNNINEKLKILENDFKLRFVVGKQNAEKALSMWSWKNIVKEYDNMFEGSFEVK